jgi:hypothetical protein
MSDGLKRTLLILENIEIDLKKMLLNEYLDENLKSQAIQVKAFEYIQKKCLEFPLNIRYLSSNVIYRSYYRWLEILLNDETTFDEKINKILNTEFVCVYDFDGEIVSLRKQIENIITKDKRKLTKEVMEQHFLERELRKTNKKYLICLSFGERSKSIEKLIFKYYNYIKRRELEYDKFCLDNNLKRSDWRCKILTSQKQELFN